MRFTESPCFSVSLVDFIFGPECEKAAISKHRRIASCLTGCVNGSQVDCSARLKISDNVRALGYAEPIGGQSLRLIEKRDRTSPSINLPIWVDQRFAARNALALQCVEKFDEPFRPASFKIYVLQFANAKQLFVLLKSQRNNEFLAL